MNTASAPVSALAEQRRRGLFALRPDAVDVEALSGLKVRACQLKDCGGRCCHDGAGLLPDEAMLLEAIRRDHAQELLALGLRQVPGVKLAGGGNARTEVARDACSWRLEDGRCSLQALAVEHGLSPWDYKPLACVLFPLRVRTRRGLRVLTADARATSQNTAADVPDCARWRQESAPLAGLRGEAAYIKNLWGHDILAASASRTPAVHSENEPLDVIGLTAVSKKHAVWACVDRHAVPFAVKQPLSQIAAARTEREQSALARFGGDNFLTASETQLTCDRQRCTTTNFRRGMLTLGSWMRTAPALEEIEVVARALLQACERLEKSGRMHGDMAFKNVLVHPRRLEVVLTDLESMFAEGVQPLQGNGDFGAAAPELYLNHPGPYTCRTETFFVGAFLFHALHRGFRSESIAFPFTAATDGGREPICSVMWALLGDPHAGYSPESRLGAKEVLGAWSAGGLPAIPRGPFAPTTPVSERIVRHPGGVELRFHPRGLELRRAGQVIAHHEGLVDVASAPERWSDDSLIFGAFSVSPSGICPVDSPVNKITRG